MFRRTNALNRLHSTAIRLNCKYAARVYCISVHNNGTRTALAQIAALLRPRETSFLPQDMEQRLFCLNGEAAPLPIEHQFYLVFGHLCPPVFVILVKGKRSICFQMLRLRLKLNYSSPTADSTALSSSSDSIRLIVALDWLPM